MYITHDVLFISDSRFVPTFKKTEKIPGFWPSNVCLFQFFFLFGHPQKINLLLLFVIYMYKITEAEEKTYILNVTENNQNIL